MRQSRSLDALWDALVNRHAPRRPRKRARREKTIKAACAIAECEGNGAAAPVYERLPRMSERARALRLEQRPFGAPRK